MVVPKDAADFTAIFPWHALASLSVFPSSSCMLSGARRGFVMWMIFVFHQQQRPIRAKLVDIAAEDFDASRYGRTQDEVMGSIHGVTRGGAVVSGMP